jgi:hypothetical protein
MKPMLLMVIAGMVALILPFSAAAQDDPPLVPLQGTWTYTALNREADCGYVSGTSTLEDYAGDLDFEWEFSLYVFDDGAQLLLVFPGDDFHYTEITPGVYEGTLASVDDDATYTSTLVVLDEDTISEVAVYTLGDDCSFTYDNAYTLVSETPAELWSETPRTLTNTSMGECLARTGIADTWIEHDLFVPIVFPDDLSGLTIGTTLYEVSDVGFQHVTEETVADAVHIFDTRLLPLDDDTFQVDFLYQIDGREDCAIAYNSELWRVNDPLEVFGE